MVSFFNGRKDEKQQMPNAPTQQIRLCHIYLTSLKPLLYFVLFVPYNPYIDGDLFSCLAANLYSRWSHFCFLPFIFGSLF
jgi:hypothetical protein